jgi:SpoVK/Ycf46/Vps4 family AAA+-type ATPase
MKYVRLPESRIQEIGDLVASWPYETKIFMRARLNQYTPFSNPLKALLKVFISLFTDRDPNRFHTLKDPGILTDWQKRFEISGQTDPQEAWNKILEKEVSAKDYIYLLSLLDKELADVHVPKGFIEFFKQVYRAYIRKEYVSDPSIPKAPIILVIGPSGSGKTATVRQVIEAVIFGNEVLPEVDLKQKRDELLAGEAFWKSIEEIDPALAMEISRKKELKLYKLLSQIPLIRMLFKERISQSLSDMEERGVLLDYTMVTPNDYQTAYVGEPGNRLKRIMGDPKKTSIRHIEEAHSAFGKTNGKETGVEMQQRTLIDTSNIILDEIINGKRDCLLIATTDQPERFDPAIYRRFAEKGKIIDISEFWLNPINLKAIVHLELLRCDIVVGTRQDNSCQNFLRCISSEDLDSAVEKLYIIFEERSLKITPSYVRKLVHSIIEIKGDFATEYLSDAVLVRKAFELVAKNAYGDLFAKVVDRMDRRTVRWDEYVGNIKYLFSEMANNCLHYGVSEEKGVVLNGPPGSGKTFLVRSWLSENSDVHDISTSPSALHNPVNPIDGAVENLEKVYDIAKMIAPTIVFFDEGDALAPKRSASGGSPSDKLTNKFLNLIDGEVPLNRVFTVLTTNRIDILDPALIRSKRLKVLEILGHLRREDINEIVSYNLRDVPLAPGLDENTIVEAAQKICNTPADYTAFVEKACSLRNIEYSVLNRFLTHSEDSDKDKENFIKFNFKTLREILDAINAPQAIRSRVNGNPIEFINRYNEIIELLNDINTSDSYPLVSSHLKSARREISQSPVKKGKVQLDQFLEAELSQEPQVGFIIGVGANDLTAVLLPIATSLTYRVAPEKVLVTGAVSSATPAASELDMAVQMTKQSAQEALTIVENYLQSLDRKVSIPILLGDFLEKYTIHHQLLSASYNVGGPSAGYALAVNTLSALLHFPVCNDFGITGAPWTKGVRNGEIGSPVIIGGHKKKAEKVLQYLRRMYMPLQNYRDLEREFLVNYWSNDSDILGVTSFGDLVPEVLWLGPDFEKTLLKLIAMRIAYKKEKYRGNKPSAEIKAEILEKKKRLREQVEKEIINRLKSIRIYLQNPERDPHLSLEEIYLQRS